MSLRRNENEPTIFVIIVGNDIENWDFEPNLIHTFLTNWLVIFFHLLDIQCSLGVEFFNANVAGEMAQLMQKNQFKYVPLMADGCSVAETVPFHGDQLFEERSRNVKWTFQDGDSSVERLEGLEPEFADWHAKFTLYKVLTF